MHFKFTIIFCVDSFGFVLFESLVLLGHKGKGQKIKTKLRWTDFRFGKAKERESMKNFWIRKFGKIGTFKNIAQEKWKGRWQAGVQQTLSVPHSYPLRPCILAHVGCFPAAIPFLCLKAFLEQVEWKWQGMNIPYESALKAMTAGGWYINTQFFGSK